MLPLADLQQQFAQAVLAGSTPTIRFAGGVPPVEAIDVHRGTIAAALTNALRISYATVDVLVGEDFFEHACGHYGKANPPKAASLAAYGEGFADFLAGFAPAASLAYLPDVARLDRAVEIALRTSLQLRCFALDANIYLELPHSLSVLKLNYPADEIRAALDDDAAMAAIVMAPAEHFVAVWRKDFEAAVQRIDPAAGRFLIALLAGEDMEAAFRVATAHTDAAQAMRAIQADIFAASFCTVISTLEELPS